MWRIPDQPEVQLLEAGERRTQRTYRYGIGLVCVGATLNWLGFAQGHGYVDPLRYLGVACVISGSFCVCLAMCRWLGRPIALHQRVRIQEDGSRRSADVHVINLSVPMYVPQLEDLRTSMIPSKPPEYSELSELPSYNDAIKLVQNNPPPNIYPKNGTQNQNDNSKDKMTPPASPSSTFGQISSSILPQSQNQNQNLSQNDENDDQKVSTPPPAYSPIRLKAQQNCNLNLNLNSRQIPAIVGGLRDTDSGLPEIEINSNEIRTNYLSNTTSSSRPNLTPNHPETHRITNGKNPPAEL